MAEACDGRRVGKMLYCKPQNGPKIAQNRRFSPQKSPFHRCSTEWPWSPLFHDLFHKVGPATPYHQRQIIEGQNKMNPSSNNQAPQYMH